MLTKPFMFLLIAGIFASTAAGQGAGKAKGNVAAGKWTTVKIDKLGVSSIMLPPGLAVGEVSETAADPKDKIPTDSFDKAWVAGARKLKKEINISVTNWHADFSTVTGETAERSTPANLVLLSLIQGQRSMREKPTRTIDSQLLEVSGVPGNYDVLNSPTDGLVAVWGTHRYYGGISQRIMITVSRFTRAEALRIIRSAVFQPSQEQYTPGK